MLRVNLCTWSLIGNHSCALANLWEGGESHGFNCIGTDPNHTTMKAAHCPIYFWGGWVGIGDLIQGLIHDKQALYHRLTYLYWLLISPRCSRFPRDLICPRIQFSH